MANADLEIDEARGPQLCVTRIRERDRDILCLAMNHVAMDGRGFKAYLGLLARLYRGEGPSQAAGDEETKLTALGKMVSSAKKRPSPPPYTSQISLKLCSLSQ